MIQMQTSLEVADNSGARRVEMIMGIGGSTGAIASLGDRIKVTVKEASPDGAIKKGTVQDAVIVRTRKEVRRRNKGHLAFVGAQPCLVCRRSPCDAHHLKFAQPRSLGRKVSDEFTVPLCRDHHLDLHRYGNETAWWANLQIVPTEAAKDLANDAA